MRAAVSGVALEERFLHQPRRLRYLIGGQGPPLLLCHGFLGSAENFESWIPELARRRTLIIPDLPGSGESEPLRGAHTCAALARSLQPLIETLGLETTDLGGLCLGAGVAFELLARNPGRVRSLILHTPLFEGAVVRRSFHLQVGLMMSGPVYPVIAYLGRRRRVSDLYKRLVVEGDDVDPHAAEVNFRNQLRCVPRAQREWLLSGLRRSDTSGPGSDAAALAAHPGEALVIVAAEDRMLDQGALRGLVAPLPRVRWAAVSDAGHGWNQEFVRRQLAILGAFLDELPLAS